MSRSFEGDDMQIHPIYNDTDLAEAVQELERLWGARAGTADARKLEVLGILVDLYERTQHPIAPPDPISAIVFRMEQMGLSRKNLEPYIGSRARVHEVLTGKRNLTLPMIRRLRDGLGISAEVLIGGSSPEDRLAS